MNTSLELSEFIKENDVKFVRLSFIDLDGRQKNLSVMAEELPRALETGVPFSARAAGFGTCENDDLLLFPDVSTLHILPWRPQHGRVARFLSSIKNADGSDVFFDSRAILSDAIASLRAANISCDLSTESEFYLFKTDSEGFPTKNTHDNAGYFDVAPLDKGENVRREICLTLEEMGIRPLSSRHERGPGQNEINFAATHALEACDNYTVFQSVVKAIASRNGLFASFMPKPIENHSGNGLALDLSLTENKLPLLGDELSPKAENFIAGIVNRAIDTELFFNSIPNSYERMGEFGAPSIAEFGFKRGQFVRIAPKYGKKYVEFLSPDNACNLYLVVALILKAGLKGIENGEKIEKSVALPKTMEEAINNAKKSSFLKEALGKEYMRVFIERKTALCTEYAANKNAANRSAFERI